MPGEADARPVEQEPATGPEGAGVTALIGDLLPLGVGIAVSPVPVIAAILMLLAPQAGRTSVAFALGWVAGVTVLTVVAAALAGAAEPDADEQASTVGGWIKIVLGFLLLALAWRQWSGRPRSGAAPADPPAWMAAVDKVTPGRALVLGAGLSAVNPKNLLLGLAAGAAVGQAAAAGTGVVLPVVVFVVVASSTVAGPVVAYALAADRLRGPLAELQTWLQANNATVMSVLLLVLGVSVLGKGLGTVSGG